MKLILPSHDTSGKITPDQDGVLTQILRGSRTIAVVGLSPKADRPSHRVAAYLQAAGYEIIPVNPGHERLLGVRAYADLAAVPDKVDIVDIFRNPKEVPAIVESAITIGAKVVWMQLDIIHEEAAAKARTAGLLVVMDRCLMIDHQRYVLQNDLQVSRL